MKLYKFPSKRKQRRFLRIMLSTPSLTGTVIYTTNDFYKYYMEKGYSNDAVNQILNALSAKDLIELCPNPNRILIKDNAFSYLPDERERLFYTCVPIIISLCSLLISAGTIIVSVILNL